MKTILFGAGASVNESARRPVVISANVLLFRLIFPALNANLHGFSIELKITGYALRAARSSSLRVDGMMKI